MTPRELDEQLAMLCHMQLAGDEDTLPEIVADLPRPEVERLLCLAVVALMDCRNDVQKQIARMARNMQEHRETTQD